MSTPGTDPSTPSERPLGKSLGKSSPSAECAATLKVLGLRALCEADAGTRTPDPFITSEVLYQLSYVGVTPHGIATGLGFSPSGPSQHQAR